MKACIEGGASHVDISGEPQVCEQKFSITILYVVLQHIAVSPEGMARVHQYKTLQAKSAVTQNCHHYKK